MGYPATYGAVYQAAPASTPYTFTVTATDCSGQSVGQTFTITIFAPVTGPPVAIATTSLPGGTEGVVYAAGLAVTGGTGPYTWTVT